MAKIEEETFQNALALFESGDSKAALALCQKMESHPSFGAASKHLLGLVLLQEKQLDRSIHYFQKAVEDDPKNPLFFCNLGVALMEGKQGQAAQSAFEQALLLDPNYPEAWNNLGNLFLSQEKLEEASRAYENALRLAPDYREASQNQALLHLRLGRKCRDEDNLSKALEHFQASVDANPNSFESQFELGLAFLPSHQKQKAIECFLRALELDPNSATALCNLGTAYWQSRNHIEAERCLNRAIDLDPNLPNAHNNLAVCYRHQGRREEQMRCLDRALTLLPDFHEARMNRGMLHLLQGEWDKGWQEFESRLLCRKMQHRQLPQPYWQGESLSGKSILLCAEQGLGDTIHFIRYAVNLKHMGARVLVQAPSNLHSLLRCVPGVDELFSVSQDSPRTDYYAYLFSLPYLLQVRTESTKSTIPYFNLADRSSHPWQEALRANPLPKIGLAWKGNAATEHDELRSLSLDQLSPVLEVPGIQWVSLQKERAGDEIARSRFSAQILDLGTHLADFAQTAVLIQDLDLVISVDTSVAHLAGALAKPVWVLLQYAPDWRWLLEREDSPWYPSMRLLRQKQYGEWGPAIAQAAESLRARLK